MTKRLFLLTLIGMLLLSACQAATPVPPTATLPPPPTDTAVPPTDTPVPPTATPAAPVFEIVGLDGSSTPFTMDEFRALPVSSGMGGTKSSTGKISVPETWTGVASERYRRPDPRFRRDDGGQCGSQRRLCDHLLV